MLPAGGGEGGRNLPAQPPVAFSSHAAQSDAKKPAVSCETAGFSHLEDASASALHDEGQHFQSAAIDHLERDVENDGQTDIGDPAMLLQQARDEGRGQAHQRDGKPEAEHQNPRMLARRAGHRQHVVERHRDVGDDDLPGRLREGLARRAGRDLPVAVEVLIGEHFVDVVGLAVAQLLPHLPAHPQQQDAAGEQEADDRQQLRGDAGEDDAQDGRGDDAKKDRLVARLLRKTRGRQADDDGVVARQHEVDHDDLRESGKHFRCQKIKHTSPFPSRVRAAEGTRLALRLRLK